MATTLYNKTKQNVDPYQLQFDINASTDITPICQSVTVNNADDLTLVFVDQLTVEEESALDAIIALHVPVEEHFAVTQLPFSRHLDGKLAVHSSSKPEPEGISTYVIWCGCGDDLTQQNEEDSIGGGELLQFSPTTGTSEVVKDVKFDPRHGRVWIHEGYLKFENGGSGDYFMADIMAPPTPLQQSTNLDYVVENDWLKYAPGGAGTGTDGLAGTPVLVPRTFAKDGDWDYDGSTLLPNFAGNGNYKITTTERIIHRYFNKIPTYGTSSTYFSMTSDETAELPVELGYFVRCRAVNVSNTDWHLSIIMEIYRERTFVP